MATEAQDAALSALRLGAFLTPSDMIAGLEAEAHGDDLIVRRTVMPVAARHRTQRWRIEPDGSPHLELDGTRLH